MVAKGGARVGGRRGGAGGRAVELRADASAQPIVSIDATTHPNDLRHRLVAEHAVKPSHVPARDLDVGRAHARAPHAQEQVAGAGRGDGAGLEAEAGVGGEDERVHLDVAQALRDRCGRPRPAADPGTPPPIHYGVHRRRRLAAHARPSARARVWGGRRAGGGARDAEGEHEV